MRRVLIVDDSPTARALLAGILSSDPELEVVGEAADGQEALARALSLRPDVITMDIQMPGWDGFDATKQIMIQAPTPIVIVSASTMVHELAVGMRALRAGALTLIRKPPGPQSAQYAAAARELIDTVKSMADVKVVRHYHRQPVPQPPPPGQARPPAAASPGAVAIAASTGGPPAIQHILAALPADFPFPILVVQHMAQGFIAGFSTWLNASLHLTVKRAERGEPLRAGAVYIAGEEGHLGVTPARRVEIAALPPIDGFCPSATYLFRSVAETFVDRTLAVILTGMGSDGVAGLDRVKQQGGYVIAQDRASSVVYGMPGAAVACGLVDQSAPLETIPQLIKQFALRSCRT